MAPAGSKVDSMKQPITDCRLATCWAPSTAACCRNQRAWRDGWSKPGSEEKCRLTLAEMIRGDLCEMLHELASLREKIVDPEWPDLMSALRLSKGTPVSREEFTEITR